MLVKSLIDIFVRSIRKPHAHLVAAQTDFRVACTLLELNEMIVAGDVHPEDNKEVIQELYRKWSHKELPQLIPFANDSMTIQISEMCQHLHDIDNGDLGMTYGKPRKLEGEKHRASSFSVEAISPSTHTSPQVSAKTELQFKHKEDEETARQYTMEAIRRRLNFAPWVGPTQSPIGRYKAGLYVRGFAPAGTVVALYPGAVFNEEMLQRPEDHGFLNNPETHRIFVPRFDGALISVTDHQPAVRNVFAVAHHARHPPAGVLANAMRLQVDYMDQELVQKGAKSPFSLGIAEIDYGGGAANILGFPTHLRPYIPNKWGSLVSAGQRLYAALEHGIYLKGAAIVTLRPIKDEEIFIDVTLDQFAWKNGTLPKYAELAWEQRKDLRKMSGKIDWKQAEDAAPKVAPKKGEHLLQ